MDSYNLVPETEKLFLFHYTLNLYIFKINYKLINLLFLVQFSTNKFNKKMVFNI